TRLVGQIDAFLADPVWRSASRLKPAQRATISRQAQHAVDVVRDMLSVADQLEDLGRGRTPWRTPLASALGRLESTFRRRGITVSRSTRRPSPVVAKLSASATAPFLVATTVARRRELEPYIALAMRNANAREIAPGHWYANLNGFPGVWADAASA